jgi:metal-responsive CopG/Arc/MetJ family transcriptional regulator
MDYDVLTTMGVSMPVSLKLRIDALAKRVQRARSDLIREGPRDLLEKMEAAKPNRRKPQAASRRTKATRGRRCRCTHGRPPHSDVQRADR